MGNPRTAPPCAPPNLCLFFRFSRRLPRNNGKLGRSFPMSSCNLSRAVAVPLRVLVPPCARRHSGLGREILAFESAIHLGKNPVWPTAGGRGSRLRGRRGPNGRESIDANLSEFFEDFGLPINCRPVVCNARRRRLFLTLRRGLAPGRTGIACSQASLYQRNRFLRRVFTKAFFRIGPRRWESPNCMHLLSAGCLPHRAVIKRVLVTTTLRRLAGPQQQFRGRRVNVGTPEVGRRIRLLPRDVVEEAEAVVGARPCQCLGKHAAYPIPRWACRLAGGTRWHSRLDPIHVELMVQLETLTTVPFTLVHADHPSCGYR